MEFSDLLTINVLLPWLLGMVFGVFVGATPGLTATMAVAMIVPISFHLDPAAGLALIIGVSFTAIFAGDIPATYLRIPGTPASAAATLDGHELAKRGKGMTSLIIDLCCSSIGGLIGVFILIVMAPSIAGFALRFSSYEYFWLGVLGLGISTVVSRGSPLKGIIAVCLGLLIRCIGMDGVSGVQRFTFGNIELMSGLELIPVMIGIFGISELLRNLVGKDEMSHASIKNEKDFSWFLTLKEIWKNKWVLLKSSTIGTFIGALPGAGADIAAWGAYGLAQKTSKQAKKFGTGITEGVVAPTSANNAAIGGAWIPALVFGIPGDAVTAIVLGALLMYDIKPGPMIFEQSGDEVNTIFSIALITQLLLLIAGFIGIKAYSYILKLPKRFTLVGVVLFSIVGAYAMRNSIFDVYVMFAFGLIGFYLESRRVPIAPLILGFILLPMLEKEFRGGMVQSEGSLLPFFTRPISAILVILLVVAFLSGPLIRLWKRKRAKA